METKVKNSEKSVKNVQNSNAKENVTDLDIKKMLHKIDSGKIDFSTFEKTLNKTKIVNRVNSKKSIYLIFLNDESFENGRILLEKMGFKIEKKQKESQIRNKLRNILINNFVSPIIGSDDKFTPEDKQNLLGLFTNYYQVIYSNNDLTLNSLVNSTFDQIKDVEKFLETFKNYVSEKKIKF